MYKNLNVLLKAFYFAFIFSTSLFSQEVLIQSDSKAGWWNQPIENESGNIIIYEVFTDHYAYSHFTNDTGFYDVNIIVYDIVNDNMIATLTGYQATPHNGSEIKWIDDTHFAIYNRSTANIDIWDIYNTSTGPDATYDNDSYGVCGSMYPMDFNDNNGDLLLTGQMQYWDHDSSFGDVMLLDAFTGDTTVVLYADAFVPWIDSMKAQLVRLEETDIYSWDPKDWMIAHKYFSPDGNLIWIKLNVRDTSHVNSFDFGFTFKADPNDLDIVFYDAWARSHPTWWDNNRLYNDDGWIYNRNGSKAEKIVGYTLDENNNRYYTPTLHPGISPITADYPRGKYVVGEDGNQNIPLTMQLFKSGVLGPLATLFISNDTNLIWCNQHSDNHFHVNPSFSRDGKRVYYTRQVSSDTIGLYAYDIPEDVYYTGNGKASDGVWDDVNISVHPSYNGWFFSDFTKYITNDSKEAIQFKGPWHNVSKGYSFPMGVDGSGNVYSVGNQRFYELLAGWDDINTAGHTDFDGWFYSDVSINYATGGSPNNRAKWGPWHNPNKGYSLPMIVDQNGYIYSVNGKSHYDDDISNDGWEEVPGYVGWFKSDITIYEPNGETTTFRNIGPWHNPEKGYCLPMGVDGYGKIYSATLSSPVSGYNGWYKSNILVHTITNPQNESGYSTFVKPNTGPWINLDMGYSLPMVVDLDGNIYSGTNGNWSSWDDVNTAGHLQYNGWFHSGITINKTNGETIIYNKKGPWHNPTKGFSLPISVDNKGSIYIANGMSRFNRKEGLVEVWPDATHYSGQDWYFSDLSVLLKGGGEWFYLDGGPWFNFEKGYSLPLSIDWNLNLCQEIPPSAVSNLVISKGVVVYPYVPFYSVRVDWDYNSLLSDFHNYKVERKVNNASWTVVANITDSDRTYWDDLDYIYYHYYLSTEPSDNLQYRVCVVDDYGLESDPVTTNTEQHINNFFSKNPDNLNEEEIIPDEFSMSQNYPNPFNPITIIKYGLKEDRQVVLCIYNMLGQKVKVLVDEFQLAGYKQAIWNGTNDNGIKVPSGVYFYRIQAGDFVQTKRMLLIK